MFNVERKGFEIAERKKEKKNLSGNTKWIVFKFVAVGGMAMKSRWLKLPLEREVF